MMEAASISETSVNFDQTTRRNNQEDSHLHTRRHENLKSHPVNFIFDHSDFTEVQRKYMEILVSFYMDL
jgi:hypothetical protein